MSSNASEDQVNFVVRDKNKKKETIKKSKLHQPSHNAKAQATGMCKILLYHWENP
jgi:hypothetical protein